MLLAVDQCRNKLFCSALLVIAGSIHQPHQNNQTISPRLFLLFVIGFSFILPYGFYLFTPCCEEFFAFEQKRANKKGWTLRRLWRNSLFFGQLVSAILGLFYKKPTATVDTNTKRMECRMKFDLCAPPAYSFFARVVSWVQVNVYVNWSEGVVSLHYWDRSANIQERMDWINNSCIALQFKLVTTVDELKSYIDRSQLTPEFGGVFHYDHDEWIRFRIVSNACNCKWNFLPKLSNLSNYRK